MKLNKNIKRIGYCPMCEYNTIDLSLIQKACPKCQYRFMQCKKIDIENKTQKEVLQLLKQSCPKKVITTGNKIIRGNN